MKADGGFVEHVEHADQVRADLRRQADALPFPAGERRGATAEREIAHADIVQEPQALLNLFQDALGDDRFPVGEIQTVEHGERFGDRQVDVIGDGAALHSDRQALRLEPLPVARGAGPKGAVRLQLLLLGPGPFVVTAAQVGQQSFELPAGAGQHGLARLAWKARERHRQIDPEVA